MRLAFVTQVLDADHPALAQTIDMVDALGSRCDEVVVFCDHVGRYQPPANVSIRAFGARSRVGRGFAFERVLASQLRTRDDRPDAALVHMVPVFLTLAAPLCKAYRIPLGLWYTHWHADRSLRLATRLADVVLSVDQGSFPLRTPKLRGIGHAIDVTRFPPPRPKPQNGSLRLLGLGRMTPWKGYTTMLEALEVAIGEGLDAELVIRGPALTDAEAAHRDQLERMIAASRVLRERVRLEPPVGRDRVPGLLAEADVFLSATQPEGNDTLDKVVYEASAAGIPVASSNPLLDAFLGELPVRLRFARGDPDDLARVLLGLAAAGPRVRDAVGLELRRRVEAGHSVQTWADAVLSELSAVSGPGRG